MGSPLVYFPTWRPFAKYDPDVLFEGYCNYPSSLSWTSVAELVLRCSEFTEVRTQRMQGPDFSVRYEGTSGTAVR